MAEVSACNWIFVEVLAFQVTVTGIPHCRHSVNETTVRDGDLACRDVISQVALLGFVMVPAYRIIGYYWFAK